MSKVVTRPDVKSWSKWAGTREALKQLPEGKALLLKVPSGQQIREYAQRVRVGVGGKGAIKVEVREDRINGTLYIWEVRP